MNIIQNYQSDSESEKDETVVAKRLKIDSEKDSKSDAGNLDFFSLNSLKPPSVDHSTFVSKRITPAKETHHVESSVKSPYVVSNDNLHVPYVQSEAAIDIQELQKLGHKLQDGPIKIVEVNQSQRLREFQNQTHSADHILPAKDTRKRHTIFSLASKATEEQGLMEMRKSNLEATRQLSKKRYGF